MPDAMKWIRFTIKALLIIIAAIAVIIAVCYLAVEIMSHKRVYDNVEDVPYNRIGLVLGTNPKTGRGYTNYYFKYRIDAATALYKAGKVEYLLVSGDNHIKEYDEPTAMRDALIKAGVPESRIVLDYAGFRTLDSVIRAREVFGQKQFTVISQPFHNKRSVCIGALNNIDVCGYNAKDVIVRRSWLKQMVRESLSRVKMFIDHITGKQPHFLGEEIHI